uniref:Phycocyanobilin lyase subunit beta n=1 Tax=Lygus hesperus TaxID=30085 RepID=A0A0A9VQV7_LYGHE
MRRRMAEDAPPVFTPHATSLHVEAQTPVGQSLPAPAAALDAPPRLVTNTLLHRHSVGYGVGFPTPWDFHQGCIHATWLVVTTTTVVGWYFQRHGRLLLVFSLAVTHCGETLLHQVLVAVDAWHVSNEPHSFVTHTECATPRCVDVLY